MTTASQYPQSTPSLSPRTEDGKGKKGRKTPTTAPLGVSWQSIRCVIVPEAEDGQSRGDTTLVQSELCVYIRHRPIFSLLSTYHNFILLMIVATYSLSDRFIPCTSYGVIRMRIMIDSYISHHYYTAVSAAMNRYTANNRSVLPPHLKFSFHAPCR